ncbi:hypothetical protein KSF78_0009096 [Schistosoma japonicum]|nr:hypothetical protein KSF78_0009096 [Schistosoma japonicum]
MLIYRVKLKSNTIQSNLIKHNDYQGCTSDEHNHLLGISSCRKEEIPLVPIDGCSRSSHSDNNLITNQYNQHESIHLRNYILPTMNPSNTISYYSNGLHTENMNVIENVLNSHFDCSPLHQTEPVYTLMNTINDNQQLIQTTHYSFINESAVNNFYKNYVTEYQQETRSNMYN